MKENHGPGSQTDTVLHPAISSPPKKLLTAVKVSPNYGFSEFLEKQSDIGAHE